MNNFTIICYKPSSVDVCRGCVMSTYESDFILKCGTKDEILETFADVLFKNMNHDHGEDGYETTILENGLPVEDELFESLRLTSFEKAIVLNDICIAKEKELMEYLEFECGMKIRMEELNKLDELKKKYE